MVSAEAESDTMICFVQTLFSSKGNTGSEMGKWDTERGQPIKVTCLN